MRRVDVAKGNMFCRAEFVEEQAARLFSRLKDENHLRGLPSEKLVEGIACYFGEVNVIHPFREGNGRTQRKFFEIVSRHCGYTLTFASVTDKEMIEASAEAFVGNYRPLEGIIRRSLSKPANHRTNTSMMLKTGFRHSSETSQQVIYRRTRRESVPH